MRFIKFGTKRPERLAAGSGPGESGIGREGGTWSFDFYRDVESAVYAPSGWRAGARNRGG